ncbi:MAG: CPBP family intramembrane glutamic endopeptidase [Bacteroidota bacterium]
MEETTDNHTKVNWLNVCIYYALACSFSWPFFWWRDMDPESWKAWQVPQFIKNLSYMWGPGFAGIIVLILFRKSHRRTITFFGTSVLKSLVFYLLPIIALSVFAIKGEEAYVIPVLGFMMILGEELGWRGFLQDALRPLTAWKRYLLIGVLWELWHFTNRMQDGFVLSTFIKVGAFMLVTILLSFILGRLTDRTRSLVVAVTLHAWVDILFEFQSTATFIIFGLSIPFWALMLWYWNKPLLNKQ